MITKNTQLDIYNKAYQSFTPEKMRNEFNNIEQFLEENNRSLVRYLKSFYSQFGSLESLKEKSILEVGCGLGGLTHFLSQYARDITGVDISSLAIMNAKEIASLKQLDLTFQTGDVCAGLNLNKKFDVIIDSHLLHCLTSRSDRKKYFQFVKNHLNHGGFFLCETMAHNDEIQEPLGYELTQENVLMKEVDGVKIPIRTIYSSIEIESEIKRAGFKINYLYYHDNMLHLSLF